MFLEKSLGDRGGYGGGYPVEGGGGPPIGGGVAYAGMYVA